jgi:tripartite-type tricarboxylate transporter receptor subunit TctC
MLGGQMLVGSIGLPPLVPHIREGRLRGLAISTSTRSPLLPEVPTISEAALPGVAFSVWYGLVGPRGLPAEIVAHVSTAVREALASPEVVQKLAQQGLTTRYMPPAEFDAFMATERVSWGDAARASGVSIE